MHSLYHLLEHTYTEQAGLQQQQAAPDTPGRKIRPQAQPSRHPRARTPSAAATAHTHPDRADYPPRARRRTPSGCIPGSSTSSSAPPQHRRDGPPRPASLPPSLSLRLAAWHRLRAEALTSSAQTESAGSSSWCQDRDQSRAQPWECMVIGSAHEVPTK